MQDTRGQFQFLHSKHFSTPLGLFRRPGVCWARILVWVLRQYREGSQRSGPRLGHGDSCELGIKAGGGDIVVALRLCTKAASARVGVQSTLLLPRSYVIYLLALAINGKVTICGDQWRVFIKMFCQKSSCLAILNSHYPCYIWSHFLISSALSLQINLCSELFVVCVCLSGTRLSPMNSLLQKSQKMTKSECPLSCEISSEPSWCRRRSVHSWRTSIAASLLKGLRTSIFWAIFSISCLI